MLGEAGDARVGVGREGGVVLVVVLERDRVLGGGVVVEVGNGNVRGKAAGAGDECVVRCVERWERDAVRGSRWG